MTYYEKNREKLLKYQKEYNLKNQKKIIEYQHTYWLKKQHLKLFGIYTAPEPIQFIKKSCIVEWD